MDDSVETALTFWREQREQLRQSENQRSVLTNYVMVLAGGLSGLIVQQEFTAKTLPLALLLVGIGLYGALSSAKYHERAEYYLAQARALTEVLRTLAAPGDDIPLVERREIHYAKYPRLHRLRLHWLWTGLHLAIASYGIVLTLIVLTR